MRPLIIGVGNAMRCDDGAGPALVDRLKHTLSGRADLALRSGEGGSLMALWEGRPLVIVVDAVCSGASPGTIHRIEAHREHVPGGFFNYSTHAFSLAEAVELSRALDTLPQQLIIFGIEGECFDAGDTLSLSVSHALAALAKRIPHELVHLTSSGATT
jgi:hydrogenase maturation protease